MFILFLFKFSNSNSDMIVHSSDKKKNTVNLLQYHTAYDMEKPCDSTQWSIDNDSMKYASMNHTQVHALQNSNLYLQHLIE